MLLGLVWLVALGLAGVLAARWLAFDRARLLTVLNAQTVWLYLPAYAIVSAALLFRRFALAALAGVVVAAHVALVAGAVGSAEPIPPAAASAPQLRLVTANLRNENRERDALAAELLATDADVLVVQEVTEEWDEVLERSGVYARYPHRTAIVREDAGGGAILSRLPIGSARRDRMREDWALLSAVVSVGSRSFTVVNVHPAQPALGWRIHRSHVRQILARVAEIEGPRVVAGDFNATAHNRFVRDVERLGLDSAHERRGRGLAVTWPNELAPLPPVRIDHVLVDDAFSVLTVRELEGEGSDHRPVLVDLALTG